MGRHVSIKTQREVEWRFDRHCGFPGCRKPARDMHHTKRFAIVQRHLADEIVPLCKIHHELAHAGLIKGEEMDTKGWELGVEIKRNVAVKKVDEIVRNKRKEAVKKRSTERTKRLGISIKL